MQPPKIPTLTNKQKAGTAGVAVVSAGLISFVSCWEGTEYRPYQDIVGVWTVCEGITGKHVIPGKTYSRKECNALLEGALEKHGQEVLKCVMQPITQSQYEALASLTYNVGVSAICNSTLVKKINAGYQARDWCQELLKWNRAGGRFVQGLDNRRKAEFVVCLKDSNGR